ncbi:MAG TPA: DUF1841 family protein [Gammaproteobacteria bacterium]|nr:DUF1841 family protein [Gammaproteobacteria bacterium]
MFGQDRDQLRAFYCKAWAAHRQGEALEPLQAQIVRVMQQHPEYHALLERPEQALGREYLPESGDSNPFLHMGMHIAIQEQIDTDRPAGIRTLYRRLLLASGDRHELEHRLMECLAEMLWQAQRTGTPPDEQAYLACIRRVAGDGD